jgi:hypothetical protein
MAHTIAKDRHALVPETRIASAAKPELSSICVASRGLSDHPASGSRTRPHTTG